MTPEKFTAILKEKIKETEDITTFRFEREDGKRFEFLPGRFVNLMIETMPKEFGTTRAYSICSSPLSQHIDLTIKIKDHGYTKLLSDLEIGTKVTMLGPLGEFKLDPEKDSRICLLAGGIGITPFMSMVRFIAARGMSNKVVLLYSSRTEEDTAFRKELEGIAKRLRNIRIVITLTRERKEGFEHGRIDEKKFLDHVPIPKDYTYFICGSKEMVDTMPGTLKGMGIPYEKIRVEKW